jgi:PAS domain S-box-containing protein
MQTLHRRFSVVAGFALLLMVLVVNALILRRQLDVQVGNRDRLAQSAEVLLELTRAESLLVNAETGQRGYLFTGDPEYLAPYNQADSQIGPQIETLSRLTVDEPRQQAHISVLRILAKVKLNELAQTISLYQSGKLEDARALVLSGKGKFAMDEFRNETAEMAKEERSQEVSRSAVFQNSLRVTITCIYLASAIAALGSLLLAFYIFREMNLRDRHAKELHDREEWYRVTLSSLGDAVIATDETGKVTFLNPIAEQLTGWSLAPAKGKKVDEVFSIFNEYTNQPVDNPVQKVMELGSVIGLANHTILRHKNGTIIPIEDSAAPIRDDRGKLIGVVLVFRDATQARNSQEILRKTEKLAAAARLASTFAHEINNPLEAVVNLVYIAKVTAGLPTAAIEPLELAEHELERVSHIARQTLGFYRESKVPDRVDMPAVIDNVLKLYSNKLKTKSIEVEREFKDCPPVHGLAGELTQAISNLISNAADAAPLHGTIRAKLAPIERADGQWLEVVIEDNGPGILPELMDRIFEPFFTTKIDVGTGLGLWVAKEIVQRHGGWIEVLPSDGVGSRGAAFHVLLPCAHDL